MHSDDFNFESEDLGDLERSFHGFVAANLLGVGADTILTQRTKSLNDGGGQWHEPEQGPDSTDAAGRDA